MGKARSFVFSTSGRGRPLTAKILLPHTAHAKYVLQPAGFLQTRAFPWSRGMSLNLVVRNFRCGPEFDSRYEKGTYFELLVPSVQCRVTRKIEHIPSDEF